jgi:hypothetical protein
MRLFAQEDSIAFSSEIFKRYKLWFCFVLTKYNPYVDILYYVVVNVS